MLDLLRDVRDTGLIPRLGRSGMGNGNLLQYSCLENPMDRGAGQATVPGVTKSWTQVSNFHFGASLIAQLVRNLSAIQETLVQFLGRENPLEKG